MTSKESTSLVQRCSDFVSEHKKAIIIGTAAIAIAAGGAAYYASTSGTPGTGDGNGERKSKRKSGKSSKKRKTVNDKDGPILEERSPKIVEEAGE
jgi:import receptor subunit TOM70